jgi:hypothetical protein
MMLYNDGKMTRLQAGDVVLVEYKTLVATINFRRAGKPLNIGRPYVDCGFTLLADPNSIRSIMDLMAMGCQLTLEEVCGGFILHTAKDPAFT